MGVCEDDLIGALEISPLLKTVTRKRIVETVTV
jgi:hypothetical protein